MAKQSGKDASNLFAELAKNRQASSELAAPPETPEAVVEPTKKGRAKGKRSNPDYIQVGVYIPKEVKKKCDRRLLDEDIDFSDLVAELLTKWLTSKSDNQSNS